MIGSFGESVGMLPFAGAVHVLHGKRNGLTAKGDRLWHQDVDGIKGAAEAGDEFGILNRFLD